MAPSGLKLRALQAIAAESAVALGYVSGVMPAPAWAENWVITPAVSVTETYSTNANLAPSSEQQSSFITSLTPSVAVSGTGARVKLSGSASVQSLVYLGERRDSSLYPQVNLVGSVEAIEKLFFIEGAINVSQQYLSPFGPQTSGNVGQTSNRYTSLGYRLSPYVRGVLPGDLTYLIRNDNIWSDLSSTSTTTGVSGSYVNQWSGRLYSPVRPFGWSIEGDATKTKFSNQASLTTEIVRAYLHHQVDPHLRLSAIGGYEDNNYAFDQSSGGVYGSAAEWSPTDRTNVNGRWERRFFGSSYFTQVAHRNPFSAFNVNISRDISSYPQQLFGIPAGGDVASLVNASLTTRIPDPAQRAQAVQEFLRSAGLPSTLQSPLNFYTQRVIRYTQQSATIALLGVRNTAALTLYNRKSEEISRGNVLTLPLVLGDNNNTQRGASISYSHRLTGFTSLNATATRYRTVAIPPFTGNSRANLFLVSAGTRLGPRTDAFTGLTYSVFDSDISSNYRVSTAYVGVNHRY